LFFVTGDEHYWDKISKNDFQKVFGKNVNPTSLSGDDFWTELKK